MVFLKCAAQRKGVLNIRSRAWFATVPARFSNRSLVFWDLSATLPRGFLEIFASCCWIQKTVTGFWHWNRICWYWWWWWPRYRLWWCIKVIVLVLRAIMTFLRRIGLPKFFVPYTWTSTYHLSICFYKGWWRSRFFATFVPQVFIQQVIHCF